jgi:hypothetical protein
MIVLYENLRFPIGIGEGRLYAPLTYEWYYEANAMGTPDAESHLIGL